jgi:hypothetical protein
MELTGIRLVIRPGSHQKEIMMMQQTVPAAGSAASTKQQIPQHLVERLEQEWKQMRESAAAPVPAR